jgi:hypothetical protein
MLKITNRKGPGYLLDDLSQAIGCDYLSDLQCNPFYRYPLYFALPCFPIEEYDADEWSKAVTYILGQPAEFSTVTEAVGFLHRAVAAYTGLSKGLTVARHIK